jgi:putative transcriptional regulator
MYKPNYKPLWITLIKKDKIKNDLRNDLGIAGSTIAKMAANQFVAMKVIAQLCEYLECEIQEVVRFEPGE